MRLLIAALCIVTFTQHSSAQPITNSEFQKQHVLNNLSSIQSAFVENRGQWDDEIIFKAYIKGTTFWFYKDKVILRFPFSENWQTENAVGKYLKPFDFLNSPTDKGMQPDLQQLIIQFTNSNTNVHVKGEEQLTSYNNYFYGNDPAKWRSHVPNYSSIIYQDIYAGIDLKFYRFGNSIKYDLIIHPGGNISQIRFLYNNQRQLSLTGDGNLQISTDYGFLTERAPHIYQRINDLERSIPGKYMLSNGNIIGFNLDGEYDKTRDLVIDPELIINFDLGPGQLIKDVAVDRDGYIYLVGFSYEDRLPLTNPYDSVWLVIDAFILKLSESGNNVIYCTYLGGSFQDFCEDIALDEFNNMYVTGFTYSLDFPVINAFCDTLRGIPGYNSDIFVSKLSAEGDMLNYSTYIGGNNDDTALKINIDNIGCAFVTGTTRSSDFPLANPIDSVFGGYNEGCITKFTVDGRNLIYSTYFGGTATDNIQGSAVGPDGNLYVAGWTNSSDFPLVNSLKPMDSRGDAFAAKISYMGDSLIYSTLLGGSDIDECSAIAVDSAGDAYLLGMTFSTDFPTFNAFDSTFCDSTDAFILKLAEEGDSIIFSSYFGGSGNEWFVGESGDVAIDESLNVYITGSTSSIDFPILNAMDCIFNGILDAYVLKVSNSGEHLDFCTYLPTDSRYIEASDVSQGIAIDNLGNIIVAGWTGGSYIPDSGFAELPLDALNSGFMNKMTQNILCNYAPGDANASGNVNGLDVTYGVNYFKGGTPPPYRCECTLGNIIYAAGDVNGTCSFNGIDITYFVSYLKGGAPLHFCPDCPPAVTK